MSIIFPYFMKHFHLCVSIWTGVLHTDVLIFISSVWLCANVFQTECIWHFVSVEKHISCRMILILHCPHKAHRLITIVFNWQGGCVVGAVAWSLFGTQVKWSHYIALVWQLITVFLLVITIPLQADSGDWKWSLVCTYGNAYMKVCNEEMILSAVIWE